MHAAMHAGSCVWVLIGAPGMHCNIELYVVSHHFWDSYTDCWCLCVCHNTSVINVCFSKFNIVGFNQNMVIVLKYFKLKWKIIDV